MEILHPFFLSFIPIFVAINAPSVLPIYIAMTEEMSPRERQRVAHQSAVTAVIVAIVFVIIGQAILRSLSIEVEDFMIAGGILLLVISISDMLKFGESKLDRTPTLGVVPLGTPLLAGPATLTTSLILVDSFGYIPVIFSLILNSFIAWLILYYSEAIIKLMGINGTRAFAKVSSLLLAAIAIKLIRTGIFKIVGG
ncbi:MAG: MarC family protein [Thermodesulfovibrionales bacterium]|nr:MarC family protein [Thermodesulfovibrionales bacterium]